MIIVHERHSKEDHPNQQHQQQKINNEEVNLRKNLELRLYGHINEGSPSSYDRNLHKDQQQPS